MCTDCSDKDFLAELLYFISSALRLLEAKNNDKNNVNINNNPDVSTPIAKEPAKTLNMKPKAIQNISTIGIFFRYVEYNKLRTMYNDIHNATFSLLNVNTNAKDVIKHSKQQKTATLKILENMNSLDVATCYFKSSKEAIAHSREIGLME